MVSVRYESEQRLSNLGAVSVAEIDVIATPASQSTPCYVPTEMVIVSVTGDVVTCFEDACSEHSPGNVLTSQPPEIWIKPEVQELRRRPRSRDHSVSAMCMACINVYPAEPGLPPFERPVLEHANVHSPGAVPALKAIALRGRAS